MNPKLAIAFLLLSFASAHLVGQEAIVAKPDPVSELEKDLCIQLERLLLFKNTAKFKELGFGEGGPYKRWLNDIEKLREVDSKQLPKDAPPNLRFAAGELMQLGMEYMQEGRDTEYVKNILPQLKVTIGYDRYQNEKVSDRAKQRLNGKREWVDASGDFQVEATFVSYKNGVITLKKTDGQNISVPIARLDESDRTLVRQAYEPTPTAKDSTTANNQGDEPE